MAYDAIHCAAEFLFRTRPRTVVVAQVPEEEVRQQLQHPHVEAAAERLDLRNASRDERGRRVELGGGERRLRRDLEGLGGGHEGEEDDELHGCVEVSVPKGVVANYGVAADWPTRRRDLPTFEAGGS